jgi:sulfatase modifying factor 1
VARPLHAIWLLTCACQLVGGYDEFHAGTPAPVAPEHTCDALPLAKDDPAGFSVMTRVDVPERSCVWMDRTEVTVEQYERWLGEVASDSIAWEPDWCAWKRTRTDPIGDPADACADEILHYDLQPFAPQKPMRCVDFCEAEAFCRFAGKRICYDPAGLGVQGPRGFPQEWQLACTNGLSTRYPWGNPERDVCNVGQTSSQCIGASATCGPLPVGQKAECVNERGIVDLTGNVAEWVFSCNFVDSAVPDKPPGCVARGGGYDEPLQTCQRELVIPNDTRAPSLGFRCCADLTPDEQLLARPTAP